MRMHLMLCALAVTCSVSFAETNSPAAKLTPREVLQTLAPKQKQFDAIIVKFARDQGRWPTNTLDMTRFATDEELPLDLSVYSSLSFAKQEDGGLRVVFGYPQFSQKVTRSFRIGTETVNIHANPHTRDVKIRKIERRDSVSPEELSNKPGGR